MIYSIGDELVCKKAVSTLCLEMTNMAFTIAVGDKYIVSDRDDFPDSNEYHWYELMSIKDHHIVLNAWNDKGHMVIDDSFEKL